VHGKHVLHDVDAARRLLNVAPQEEALYPASPAAENLAFFAELYGVPRAERGRAVSEALDAVGLTGRRNDRVDTYSGGMRRRLNLGCALVSGPRVVLLDEPTVAVDPQSRAHIFDAVRALRARGTTILYTTHHLQEAEDLCDRIAIMDEGRVVACRHAARAARPVARDRGDRAAAPRAARDDGVAAARSTAWATSRRSARPARLRGARAAGPAAALSRHLRARPQRGRTRVTPVTLDDVFLELTGKALRD
jgi:ABC-2 type transport system ATP-binding protein